MTTISSLLYEEYNSTSPDYKLKNSMANDSETLDDSVVNLWDKLPNFINDNKILHNTNFQTLVGMDQIIVKEKEMILNTKHQALFFGSEKHCMRWYNHDLIDHIRDLGTDVKILTSCTQRTSYIFEDLIRAEIKKMPTSLTNNLFFIIKDGNELLIMKNEELCKHGMMAVSVSSPSIIEAVTLLFQDIWSISR